MERQNFKDNNGRWFLPYSVDDMLPPQAEEFAKMQQKVLEIIFSYGYHLIAPSHVEFAASLNISHSRNLEADIAHFGDNSGGETLGLRADFTPQATRIDAGVLNNNQVNRLCYCGETFRAGKVYDRDMRNTVHIGAELYGDSSLKSDIEIIELMLSCLGSFCKEPITLFIGQVAFVRRILKLASLNPTQEEYYVNLLSAKSMDYINNFVNQLKISSSLQVLMKQLPQLYGDRTVLARAKKLTDKLEDQKIKQILKEIKYISNIYKDKVNIYIDLGEMPGSGYSYHDGLVFGTYFQDKPTCFAEGGRYNAFSKYPDVRRPATGFSMDMKRLFYYVNNLSNKIKNLNIPEMIFAPYIGIGSEWECEMQEEVARLRKKGKRVICALNKNQSPESLNCIKELVKTSLGWKVESVN